MKIKITGSIFTALTVITIFAIFVIAVSAQILTGPAIWDDPAGKRPFGHTHDLPAFADGDWTISGNNMFSAVSGNVGIGTATPAAKLTVDGAILREGSTMIGPYPYTHINLGMSSTTGPAGSATVGGGFVNIASGGYATVGGGLENTASGERSTVPGGFLNTAGGMYSFAAGRAAKANHFGTFVWSDATGGSAFASTGGNQFLIRAAGGVGIGTASPTERLDVNGKVRVRNLPLDDNLNDIVVADVDGVLHTRNASTLGGDNDWAWSSGSGLAGVIYHTGNVGIGTASPAAKLTVNGAILREGSVMIGTNANTHINLGTNSTTGRTSYNRSYATVSGGVGNIAYGENSTVGGGYNNTATGSDSVTIGGGYQNNAWGQKATVGGGYANNAEGNYATIPGGYLNSAGGNYSFAAGKSAKANHNGTFVWADSTNPSFPSTFQSTGPDQFLILASGGVGIGTASPQGALDVTSTTGGFIVPRMTTTQRNALIPVNGMIIYNTTTNAFNFYENGAWVTK